MEKLFLPMNCQRFSHISDGSMEVTLIFVILSTILLWAVIGSKGNWALKMAAIFVTLMFSLNIMRSLENLSGWPSEDDLPNQFLVHWVMVEEPSKEFKTDGGIYLWVQNLDNETYEVLEFFKNNEDFQPRAYRLDYSAELHEMALKMRLRLLDGRPILGMNEEEFNELNSPDRLLQMLLEDNKKKQIGSIHNDDSDDLFFCELPPSGAQQKQD